MKNNQQYRNVPIIASFVCFLFVAVFSSPSTGFAQDSTKVYRVVDEMPEIEGGLSALYKKIEYPDEARRKEISGRVYLQVIVDEKGKASDPKILRDIGGGCGDAAAKAITKMKFKPGKQNGKKVKVQYSLPITFRIEK